MCLLTYLLTCLLAPLAWLATPLSLVEPKLQVLEPPLEPAGLPIGYCTVLSLAMTTMNQGGAEFMKYSLLDVLLHNSRN